jgi:autotransporter translocation and assembly factor TamB
MKKSRFTCTILFLLLAAAAAFAADVSGKWVAQVPGRNGQTREVTFNLKADGNNLTGTVSGRRGDTPIADGKIDGDNVSFTQTLEFGGNTVKFIYKGKISGDEIKFTRERDGGEGEPAEFTAKRGS